MSDSDFAYDVFLSHSSKDKPVVRGIAERLRVDGVRVWFDEWEIKVGDSIPAKIEDGLETSRVLVLCMSANAFGSDWARLEAGTFRFRDPLNKERRFIPLRLDDAPMKGSLAQFLYITWRPEEDRLAYVKLLEACRTPAGQQVVKAQEAHAHVGRRSIQLDYKPKVWSYAFSADGKRALTGAADKTMRLWDLETGHCLRVFNGHDHEVWSVAWSTDQGYALSAGNADRTLRLWELETGECLQVLMGHTDGVRCVVWSADQQRALSGSLDNTIRLWDLNKGECLRVLQGHKSGVKSVVWSEDQSRALSGSGDKTVRLWDLESGRCLRVLRGHTSGARCVVLGTDQRHVLSGSYDKTVRLWDLETGTCLRVFEGHTGWIISVAWSSDQRFALSAAEDMSVRLWDVETGHCLGIFQGHGGFVRNVVWSRDQRRAFSGDEKGGIRLWDLEKLVSSARTPETSSTVASRPSTQIQYTNAKVLLVGDSGAGKTGLSKVLAGQQWQASDSTIGAWATQWKLPVSSGDGVEREIWLWDFGGQADQRLIHQLYMEDTALAVLVFDGQKENLFETLGQWDRDLTRASSKVFSKLLVAGRIDAGGLRAVSRVQVDSFVNERGFSGFLETSAKTGEHCGDLKQAILNGIRWEEIPWRSSPLLFKRLKEEIVRLKDAGRVLMRFNELREALQLHLAGDGVRFTDEELKAVIGLLAGPGVVWELEFGSWVLLQPELINAYAQAVIQTLRADEHERGCLPEERVLNGDLVYHSSIPRLEPDEEQFILFAMHQTLVKRGLCIREHTDNGPLLIFPSYYRRERPELVGHPAVLVSYRFSGFLDDIYATLVVRLHHTAPFQQDELWRYAADFKTLTGKQLGVKLTRRAEGAGELEVFFDPAIDVAEKIIFSKYIHEHLLRKARDVIRLRHYVCPHCGTPVGNREVAMERLEDWLDRNPEQNAVTPHMGRWRGKSERPTIICARCEERVPLWDDMEQHFASPEAKKRVRELEEKSAIVLKNEDKERLLVGDVISTVALAGQISRELAVSDHGIDMEIEFKSDAGEATGRKLYLQLKSGDSYLRKQKRDGKEVFTIKKERHVQYWIAQQFPVLLVIRNSEGEVRWMEVRDYLKQASDEGKKPVKQIVFEGHRFDVMAVRRLRDRALASDAYFEQAGFTRLPLTSS